MRTYRNKRKKTRICFIRYRNQFWNKSVIFPYSSCQNVAFLRNLCKTLFFFFLSRIKLGNECVEGASITFNPFQPQANDFDQSLIRACTYSAVTVHFRLAFYLKYVSVFKTPATVLRLCKFVQSRIFNSKWSVLIFKRIYI